MVCFFGVEVVQIFLGDGSCKLGENRWVSAGSQGYEFGACKGRNAGTATMPSSYLVASQEGNQKGSPAWAQGRQEGLFSFGHLT